jgi:hypothetical protein
MGRTEIRRRFAHLGLTDFALLQFDFNQSAGLRGPELCRFLVDGMTRLTTR